MPELKPCPFCGDEATITSTRGEYRVECKECEAQGPPGSSYLSTYKERSDHAIDLWNQRRR